MKLFSYFLNIFSYFIIINYSMANISSINNKIDLWIVGSGNLGTEIAKEWKLKYPKSIIITETISSNRHSILKSLGTIPIKRSERLLFSFLSFLFLLFL